MSKAIVGKLQCFYDIVSPYSYIAFESLLQYESKLPVKIEFEPVFNGIIMKTAENYAPATIKRKSDQMWRDVPLVADYYGIFYKNITDFNGRVMKKRSTPTMRFLTAIKKHESEQNYRLAIRTLFTHLYTKDRDIFDVEDIRKAFDGTNFLSNQEHLFDQMNSDEIKKALVDKTNEALDNGAFGVPWLTLSRDNKDPVQLFGSDRIHIICHLLNVPFQGNLGGVVKL